MISRLIMRTGFLDVVAEPVISGTDGAVWIIAAAVIVIAAVLGVVLYLHNRKKQ